MLQTAIKEQRGRRKGKKREEPSSTSSQPVVAEPLGVFNRERETDCEQREREMQLTRRGGGLDENVINNKRLKNKIERPVGSCECAMY
jgi:hypothetical protein